MRGVWRSAQRPVIWGIISAVDASGGAGTGPRPPVRVGIIGCGRILPAHLDGLRRLKQRGAARFEVTALCARRRQDAEMFRRRGAGPPPRAPVLAANDPLAVPHLYVSDFQPEPLPDVLTDYRDLVAADVADAFIVTTSLETHHDVAVRALEAGAHVLVEKPLAITISAARRMVEAAQRSGAVLATAENARYREEVRAGRDPDRARAVAMATSGRAVAFSGATVMTSLAGLWLIDNQIIRSMALGAILVVAVSVLASATLLPALIRLLGARAHARGRVVRRLWRSDAARIGWWTRWTRRVTARPAAWALAAGGFMAVLTIPAFSLDTASGTLRQFDPGDQVRVGFAQAAKLIRLGTLAPADVVVRPRPGTDSATVAAAIRARAAADPEVAAVGAPLVGSDGRTLLIRVTPRSDAESDAAHAMVDRLRAALPAAARGRADVLIGGSSAAQRDLNALVGGSLWRIFLVVPLLSFLVLVVLLRSVVVPLKAAFTTLLSVGASYGVLVAVFQWGWFDGFLGFHSPGRVDTVIPPLVVGIVFGLSMDYEVFLLARIRERWRATGDTRTAVAEGLAVSAPTITSAALIMVAVFAVFVGTGVASVKEVGLGCAVAVGLDATVVRLVLVPATMELLGARNWWLPRPLARLLPTPRGEAVAGAAGVVAIRG
jgi:uncharacterized membrane protein YdfJ with MMPL/SSD domain